MIKKKHALVLVTNDLSNDRRVHNTCSVLTELGFAVTLVGRRRRFSLPLAPRAYRTRRLRLWFDKGFLFYAEINLHLFFFLLFHKTHLIVANDLDTLWPAYWNARLKACPLVYDTHEFFTGVPELMERPRVRRVWERIEQRIFPHLDHIITVNQSIAGLYKDLYGKDLYVIRNVPALREAPVSGRKEELGIDPDKHVILLQGAWINKDRGGEEAVEAMEFLDQAILLVIGAGDAMDELKQRAGRPGIQGKVIFTGRLPFEELIHYTSVAEVGLSLDKDTNINYRYSLPNKLFDYIHAEVPVLASPLVEVARIVKDYGVGEVIPSHQPEDIARILREMLDDPQRLAQYRENCRKAKSELCWDREKKIAEKLYARFL